MGRVTSDTRNEVRSQDEDNRDYEARIGTGETSQVATGTEETRSPFSYSRSLRLLPFPLSPAPFGPSLLTSFGPFGSGSAGNGMGGEEP